LPAHRPSQVSAKQQGETGTRHREAGMYFKQIWNLPRKSVEAWVDDYAPSMGAALAYYTLFSIAPLLIIAIAVAGLVFGQEAARGEIVVQIQGLIGQEGAIAVQGLLKSANEPAHDIFLTVVSIITLVIGATTVFAELQRVISPVLAPDHTGN
jgi:membrane protein